MFKIILIALFAASLASALKPLEFQPGKTYVYQYRGNQIKGIPNLKNEYAGFELEGKVLFEASTNEPGYVTMQLKDILQGHMFTKLQRDDTHDGHRHERNVEDLTRPIRFMYQDGRVKYVEAARDEPQWTLNIKRSILSLFNVETSPRKVINTNGKLYETKSVELNNLTYYGVYEESLTGWCETSYHVNHIDSMNVDGEVEQQVVNLTKTRNYEHCIDEQPPMAHIDAVSCRYECERTIANEVNPDGYYPISRLSKYCLCNQRNLDSSVDQHAIITYNISMKQQQPLIESIRSEGRISSIPHGDKLASLSMITMRIVRVVDTNQITENKMKVEQFNTESMVKTDGVRVQIPTYDEEGKNFENINLNLLNEAGSERMKVELIKKFNELAERMMINDVDGKRKQPTELALALYAHMRSMNKQQLDDIYRSISQTGNVQNEIRRQLYLDVLGLCGTNHAANLIIDLIENNQVNDNEARGLVESVGGAIEQPKMSTIERYFEKCSTFDRTRFNGQIWSALCYTSGKMIRKSCDKTTTNGSCDQTKVNEWIKKFETMIETSPRMPEKLSLFEGLLNTNQHESIRFVTPYVNGRVAKEKCSQLYTRKPTTQQQQQQLTLKADDECYFLRESIIYNLFHLVPTYGQNLKALLLPVFNDINENQRVRLAALNILMSSDLEKHELESIAFNVHHEENQSIRLMTINYIRSLVDKPDRKVSQTARDLIEFLPKTTENRMFDASYHTFNDSGKNAGFFVQHQITSWFNSTYSSKIPSTGYVSFGRYSGEKTKKHLAYVGFQQEGIEDYINEIVANRHQNGDVSRRMEAEPKFRLVLGLFERSKIVSLDSDSFKKMVKRFENDFVDQWLKKLEQGYNGHYVRFVMIEREEIFKTSELGLPVVISHHEPLLLSLKITQGELRKSAEGASKSFKFTAKIVPTIYYQSTESIYSTPRTTEYSFSTDVQRKMLLSTPAKWSIVYRLKDNRFTFSIVPEKKIVFEHSVKPFVRLYKWPMPEIGTEIESDLVHLIKTVPEPFESTKTIDNGLKVEIKNEEQEMKVWSKKNWSEYLLGENYDGELTQTGSKYHRFIVSLWNKIYKLYNYGGNKYHQSRVTYENNQTQRKSFDFTVGYQQFRFDFSDFVQKLNQWLLEKRH